MDFSQLSGGVRTSVTRYPSCGQTGDNIRKRCMFFPGICYKIMLKFWYSKDLNHLKLFFSIVKWCSHQTTSSRSHFRRWRNLIFAQHRCRHLQISDDKTWNVCWILFFPPPATNWLVWVWMFFRQGRRFSDVRWLGVVKVVVECRTEGRHKIFTFLYCL